MKEISSAFSLNIDAFELSPGFHMAFMSAYEAEGVLSRESIPSLTGDSVYDYSMYFLDKILFGILPGDKEAPRKSEC